MNEESRQQVSAMMDGELSAEAARFLLKRMDQEPALAEDWARWHQWRDCLHGRSSAPLRADFAAAISAAIAAEQTPSRAVGGAMLRWAGGFAIAASVALAALLVVPQGGPAPATSDNLVSAPAVSAPVAGGQVVASGLREADLRPSLAPVTQTVSATQSVALPPAVQVDPRVDAWLLRHNAASLQPMQDSFVPFIPMVSPYRPPAQSVLVDSRPSR